MRVVAVLWGLVIVSSCVPSRAEEINDPARAITSTFNGYMRALADRDAAGIEQRLSTLVRAFIQLNYGSVPAGIETRLDKEREAYAAALGEARVCGPFTLKTLEDMGGGVYRGVFYATEDRDFDPLYFVIEDGIARINGELSPEELRSTANGRMGLGTTESAVYACNLKGGFVIRDVATMVVDRRVRGSCGCLNVAYRLGKAWDNHYCTNDEMASCNKGFDLAGSQAVTLSCESTCGWFGGGTDITASFYDPFDPNNIVASGSGACADYWLGDDVSLGTALSVVHCTLDC